MLATSCPVCATPFEGVEARACPRCETPHHADCWEFAGGCAVYGCQVEHSPDAPSLPLAPSDAVRRPLLLWMRLYRLQLVAALGFGFTLLMVPLLLAGLLLYSALPWHPEVGAWMDLVMSVGQLGAGGSALLALAAAGPQTLARRSFEEQSGTRLAAPEQALSLAQDIEVSGVDGALDRVARGLATVATSAFALVVLGAAGGAVAMLHAGAPLLTTLVLAVFLAIFLAIVTLPGLTILTSGIQGIQARTRLIQTVQNRLVASTKR
jgi:hypothetical protein